jgi:hypothetical protein
MQLLTDSTVVKNEPSVVGGQFEQHLQGHFLVLFELVLLF